VLSDNGAFLDVAPQTAGPVRLFAVTNTGLFAAAAFGTGTTLLPRQHGRPGARRPASTPVDGPAGLAGMGILTGL